LQKIGQGTPLDHLLEEGIITDVVGRLQSGKEAEVFLVRYDERIVAAKVYKDKSQRSFKNKSAYQEGRVSRNTRDQRAMERGSRFGKGAEEQAWKSAEVDALYRLHAADVRVPTPLLFLEGVLLMELVVDADGVTARRLIDTTLSVEEAHAAYHDMLTQLVRILACDLIHGDLSPYNVLWAASGATIIDFPQIVSASQNSNSERFFLRDAENILGYFRAVDARLDARRGDASEIWRAYMGRELTADFLPTGNLRPARRRGNEQRLT
jgi:RIO kinase 1